MKFYEPTKKEYIYLSSYDATITETGTTGVNLFNRTFSWSVPSKFYRNGYVKLKNISSTNAGNNKYIISIKKPITNNCYESKCRDNILFISTNLNDSDFNSAPELAIKDTNVDTIQIRFSTGFQTRDNGLIDGIDFCLLLEFIDYEPTNENYSYEVNTGQNYNNRII